MKKEIKLAVDAVVFTILNRNLKILLIKRKFPPFKSMSALPGGFVLINENLDQAVARELHEETNVKNIFLKQFKTYGDVHRDPRGRIVSVAFMALIDGEKVKLKSRMDAERAHWASAYKLPQLAFDHKKIIREALEELRFDLLNTNIVCQIMPERFTLTELQKTHELILDKTLDKRNFRKKINELMLLKELHETKMEGAHRPAQLYSFKKKEYVKNLQSKTGGMKH